MTIRTHKYREWKWGSSYLIGMWYSLIRPLKKYHESDGTMPGGILVAAKDIDFNYIVAKQYAGDNTSKNMMTTHVDYHVLNS